MHDSAKYLIHADITANGVVERSDVVGAIFGQTEGLLGEELDLRELQDNSKVGRIDVEIESEGGQSFGEITVASGLDRVETAILAASLETLERVGPCRATIEVTELEDVRSAKRRTVVERATELLADFEAESVTSRDIVSEVRQRLRVEDITDYEGYPAGPRVVDSDAIVVVEGRADVLQLLQFGIKNAIAVEGTDVPEAIADLTRERTVTAFLDGDRGGELILRELAQVGSVDYVAFAPADASVEDLSRAQITSALREKVPYEAVSGAGESPPRAARDADDGSDTAVDGGDADVAAAAGGSATAAIDSPAGDRATAAGAEQPARTDAAESTGDADAGDATAGAASEAVENTDEGTDEPDTVAGHAEAVIGERSGEVRLLDDGPAVVETGLAEDAFDLLVEADAVPTTVVLDGVVDQRLLDVAAQRGVREIVAAETGEFVKQPTNVRVRTHEDL